MQDSYQIVGFIGLDAPDGTMEVNIPLYVKVKDLDPNENIEQANELMHKVMKITAEHYESQLSEYIASLKQKNLQGGETV